MKIKHFGIVILSLVSIFGVYDIWGIDVWAAVVVGYGITYFPIQLLLFLISFFARRKDLGWQRKLDTVGLHVSIFSFAITIIYFIWDTIRWLAQ